ncbi:hypothetical protein BU16DRAFT_566255 [Lophium mytilinum]|uniref:F-box domain-containing protein n=1 Tax=Lophium mytilinum TaxID=390894 RepID=A0A6A6QDW8_9PEZI|nr:hypothetical protein BU16DRAFT_566255 [Lophium mytilinum]
MNQLASLLRALVLSPTPRATNSLVDFPDEVVVQILSEEVLFKDIDLYGDGDSTQGRIIKLCNTLEHTPGLARKVQTLHLSTFNEVHNKPACKFVHTTLPSIIWALDIPLKAKIDWVGAARHNSSSWRDVHDNWNDALIAALLWTIPNLQKLRLYAEDSLSTLLGSLAQLPSRPILGTVKVLEIEARTGKACGKYVPALDSATSIMYLPSIHTLRINLQGDRDFWGDWIDDGANPHSARWRPSTVFQNGRGISAVTNLSIKNSVEVSQLASFLHSLKALKFFECSFKDPLVDQNLARLASGLYAHRKTLENVRIVHYTYPWWRSKSVHLIDCFPEFDKLHSLCVPSRALMPCDRRSTKPEIAAREIVCRLPPSLKSLTLAEWVYDEPTDPSDLCPDDDCDLEPLVHLISFIKQGELPCLRRINVTEAKYGDDHDCTPTEETILKSVDQLDLIMGFARVGVELTSERLANVHREAGCASTEPLTLGCRGNCTFGKFRHDLSG